MYDGRQSCRCRTTSPVKRRLQRRANPQGRKGARYSIAISDIKSNGVEVTVSHLKVEVVGDSSKSTHPKRREKIPALKSATEAPGFKSTVNAAPAAGGPKTGTRRRTLAAVTTKAR